MWQQLPKKLEEGEDVAARKNLALLVATWVCLKGKGGGFGKRVYRQLKTVFAVHDLCTLPAYHKVTEFWKTVVVPPIYTCIEGTSQVKQSYNADKYISK